MRSPTRRRRHAALTALTALAAGVLTAACGGGGDRGAAAGTGTAAGSHTVRLQPAGAQGPDPFTASTALPSPRPPGAPPPAERGGVRTVLGSTPGLYAGTRARPSCDVEQQVRLLTADDTKARAFAQAAGIGPAGIAPWLRGLTPVVLRADTRVTGHGYRDGSATAFQSVLQAGTAVLVDQYGAPRVRCACGNPLRSPVGAQGAAVHKGRPWAGHRPDRVLIIAPTQQVVTSLVIVDVEHDTWIERRTGTGGEQDKRPAAPPPYAPGDRHPADAPGAEPEPPRGDTARPTVPVEPAGPGDAASVPPDVPRGEGRAEPENPGAAEPEPVDPAHCPTELHGGERVPPGCPTPPPPPPPPVLTVPDGPDGGSDGGSEGSPGEGSYDGPGGGPDGGSESGSESGSEGGSGISGDPGAFGGAGLPDGAGAPDGAGEPYGPGVEPEPYEG
ncbi:hypothetical protein QWM81_12590 [Streptomyces ficellus]|uniref:DUF6777 domain-containing protein n=1 Tax=Streptomyces ficellus TaxID=1977088 RepID=A0ABT7Z5X8_9ACTN|nr:DUF6777 domain-containing protein [Streptomyces ficellus]MDN3294876.1 hypothetical protein [Streptomyces ficellus]